MKIEITKEPTSFTDITGAIGFLFFSGILIYGLITGVGETDIGKVIVGIMAFLFLIYAITLFKNRNKDTIKIIKCKSFRELENE